jgi:hypothetical protein
VVEIVVIEGPDGAGKSVLAEWICVEFGLKLGERSNDRDHLYQTTREDTWRAVHEELTCLERPRVWDRLGPYSDPIYASFDIPYPRLCAFTPLELDVFEAVMEHVGLVIFCLPPERVSLENVRDGHQLEGVVENHRHIQRAYEARVKMHYLRYNYTKVNALDHVADRVEVHLERRKAREARAAHIGHL